MSCELKTLAVIDDLASTRTALQLDNVDAWLQTVFCATTPAALNASVAAASASTSAVLCLATATRYALLRGHWDAAAQRQRYHLEHSGTLLAEPDEHITAIALLPIAAFGGGGSNSVSGSSSSSSSADLDWTCLAFGLSSGTVRFCTTSGTVLAIQQWHPTEPVHQLKVQSASRSAGLADELHVFHSTCVCSVAASPLVQLLRNRNSSARSENIELYAGLVPARRWQYGGRPGASATSPQITDAICAGPQPLASFDHLLAASREGGFYAQYKSCPPQSALVLAVGARPYAGFHWAREGVAAPVLADVARAVARHIKSALPTWLTGSASATGTGTGTASGTAQAGDAERSVVPPPPTAEPMQLRFGLCDLQRVALAVWLAPDRRHAAVADNLGRVMLVDLRSAVAVRVWKGYRDAQCGFVQANEKLKVPTDRNSQERRRHAMFLVIYAPKRACLECWLLQRGPRVAAFAVSKRGRLLSTCGAATQALGISTASHSGRSGRSSRPAGSQLPGCVFVDAQSGEMRELCVPFHCALSDEYARTSKDLHLLRRIKLCVRNGAEQPEHGGADEAQVLQEVLTCCEALQTDEVRVKCVEQLVRNTKCRPQVLQVALRALLEQQQRIADEAAAAEDAVVSRQEASPHTERLLQLATDYQGLVELYLFLNNQPDQSKPAADDSHPSTDIQLSLTELENIEQFVTLKVLESGGSASAKPTPKVHFNVSTKSIGFADFLAIFHSTEAGPRLRDDLADSAVSAIGELIFVAFIEKGRRPDGLEEAARSSGASSSDLMRLLLAYWLDRRFEYTRAEAVAEHLQRFAGCARAICRLAGPEATVRSYNEYNAISDWWQAVREQLLVAGGAVQAWLAAMMCRALAERLSREEAAEAERAREDEDGAGEEVWEQVPQEAAEWSLLVDKLDDVAVLALALGSSLRSMDQAGSDQNCSDDSMSGIGGGNADDDSVLQPLVPMPVLPFGEMDVSLAAVVRGGRGIVTDLVAKWIISLAVAPEQLCVFDADASDERSGSSRHDTSAESEAAVEQHRAPVPVPASTPAAFASPSAQTFSHYWQFLRGRFPFSLQSGAVLAHMAWEYFCHWSKHMAQMQLLQAGLRCLAAMRRPRDQRLRHGLCCMIWNAHLKIPLQATSKLVNKTGRLPTEALCMQDIGLSASLVADLLQLSAEFWGHFRESATMDGQMEVRTLQLRHEELLQDGPVALAQLAVEQPPATPALLELHAQLLQVLYVMAALNLRIPRPVQAVFDAVSVLALFSEINRPAHQPQLPPADAVLERKRTEFLLLVVSATMDSIREDHDGGVFVAEHVGWMARVQTLCEAWGLSADELRRHQVAELYAHGWDGCAERQLEAVLDVRAMGEVLLRIAGRRLNALLKNRPRMYVEVASVGSVVTDFLDILHNSRDRFERASRITVTLEALTELAIRAFTCLADSEGREKRIAAQLYDACQRLREQQELLGAESEK